MSCWHSDFNLITILIFSGTQGTPTSHDLEKIKEFIENLTDVGCSEKLAMKALQSDEVTGPEDLAGGTIPLIKISLNTNNAK